MNFKKNYIVSPSIELLKIDVDTLFISGNNILSKVNNKKYCVLLQKIDGKTSGDEIVESLHSSFNREELCFCFYEMEERGLIEEVSEPDDLKSPPFIDLKSILELISQTELKKYLFALNIVSPIDGSNPEEKFENIYFKGEHNNIKDPAIEIFICSDYLETQLRESYNHAIENNHYFFPLRIMNESCWYGPLFTAEKKVCWECLTYRIKMNNPFYRFRTPNTRNRPVQLFADQKRITAILSYAFTHILNDFSFMKQHLVSYDFGADRRIAHLVQKRRACPTCGDETLAAAHGNEKIELQERKRGFMQCGGYRCVDPIVTWNRYKHLVDPITGVVSNLQLVPGKDHPLRTIYEAEFIVPLNGEQLRAGVPYVQKCFGKGRAPTQARASALCEALERSAALWRGDEPIVRGSFHELKERAIDPVALMNFSVHQYECRDSRISSNMPFWVPKPYDSDRCIDWTPVWSLTCHENKLAPLTFCYGNVPVPDTERVCAFNSNGNAAGNCLEEAILQGLLEVIERDAIAIWWYNRIRFPAILLESFNDDYFFEIKKHYNDLGWELWCLDITNDLAIPVVVALLRHLYSKNYYMGFGSHLDMPLAVQRAITEVNQVFDPNTSDSFIVNEREIEQPYFLVPDTTKAASTLHSYPKPSEQSLKDDIDGCVAILKKNNLETIVLDYTRPDIGLSTVKVLVPGLRHFWPRFGPGRLYDVPVKMGWIENPNKEQDLNPKPLIL